MKLYRTQFKPIMVKETGNIEKPYEKIHYPTEEVSLDAILEVMPHNNRYMELLEKMLKDGKHRRYGKYDWQVKE